MGLFSYDKYRARTCSSAMPKSFLRIVAVLIIASMTTDLPIIAETGPARATFCPHLTDQAFVQQALSPIDLLASLCTYEGELRANLIAALRLSITIDKDRHGKEQSRLETILLATLNQAHDTPDHFISQDLLEAARKIITGNTLSRPAKQLLELRTSKDLLWFLIFSFMAWLYYLPKKLIDEV